jgi:hypothetical protein
MAWIRGFRCLVKGCMNEDIHAHHVRLGSFSGVGTKPGDDRTIPLCGADHNRLHMMGEASFGREIGVDLIEKAAEFAARSPKLKNRRR